MTPTKSSLLFLTVLAAGALARAAGPESDASTSTPRLRTISSRVARSGATSLVIESTEPVPYVASRPDPLTLVLDVRNVIGADSVTRALATRPNPIEAVDVEPSADAGPVGSRIRITLAQPVHHRIRSERNTIVVDFDAPGAKAAPYVVAPVTRASDPIASLGLDNAAAGRGRGNVLPPAMNVAAAPAAAAPPPPPAAQALPAAQPPAPEGQQVGAPAGGARRFTGHPVSLDFQGADLRAVLRTFSEISGLNIVIDPAVQGTVDVALRDVPWDQALDIILRANKLGYIVDGTIVRIAPLTVLAEEESQRRKLTEEQALSGELRVLTKTLSYAKAEEISSLLTKSALSQRGTVQVDPRTNTVIITDLADRLNTANELIGTLDKAQPQVEIEARIVQTTRNFARSLGIQWGFNGRVDPALGNTTNLAFPNSGSVSGRTGTTQGPAGTSTAVNLPAAGAPTAVGLALGSVNGSFNLDVALSALEQSRNGRILSTPRVTTQNNVEAEIAQGVQLGYQTVANNTVTVSFKDAALTLKVTPQITAANTVIMKIIVDNGSVGPLFNNVPSINTQRANTSVLVNDGQTTVIGGIYQNTSNQTTDRTPGLGTIPLIKWLFKRDQTLDDTTELLIFITPRILKS